MNAARLLIEAFQIEEVGSEESVKQAPYATIAILNLVAARLRDLRFVVIGDRDPRTLLTHFNAVDLRPGTKDVLLGAEEAATKKRRRRGHQR